MSRTSFQVLLFLVIYQGKAIPAQSLSDSNGVNQSSQGYEPKWVPGPDTRGTLGLVFSCAITLFLCVWTTVHVNIEPPEKQFNPTLARFIPIRALKQSKPILRFLAKRWIRKLGWGCFTLLVPEGVMAIATIERKTALLLRDAINAIISKRNQPLPREQHVDEWDMTLAYYAVMGGFVIPKLNDDTLGDQSKKTGRAEKGAETILTRDPERNSEGELNTTPGNSVDPVSKGLDTSIRNTNSDEEKQNDGVEELERSVKTTLTPYAVLQLATWQWVLPPPTTTSTSEFMGDKINFFNITSAEVRDKSNANSLAKALVAWQALWMIVQVIGRRAANLPVTLLELHTCLHTFCAVAMYIAWWSKPLDIEVPTTVPLSREQILFLEKGESHPDDPTNPWNPVASGKGSTAPSETSRNRTATSNAFLTSRLGIGKLMYYQLCGEKNIRKNYFETISDAYIRLWKGRRAVWKQGLSISFVGLVFGGVHLAAWHSSFPSYTERVLWQIAAVITATSWSGFVLSLWLSVFVKKGGKVFSRICGVIFGIGIFPVLLVRFYLLAESFVSIRRLPEGSYKLNTWSNVWPHAG